MADISKSFQPAFVVNHTPAAATAAVATFAAPAQATARIYITGFILSGTAAGATVVEATLTGPVGPTDSAVTLKFEIPAAAFAPIAMNYGEHPLKCAAGTAAVLTLPSLGGTAVGSVQLFGYVGP